MGIFTIYYEQTKGDASGAFSTGFSIKQTMKVLPRMALGVIILLFVIGGLLLSDQDALVKYGGSLVISAIMIFALRSSWHNRADVGWGQVKGVAMIPQESERELIADLRDQERGMGVTKIRK